MRLEGTLRETDSKQESKRPNKMEAFQLANDGKNSSRYVLGRERWGLKEKVGSRMKDHKVTKKERIDDIQ